MNLAFIFMYNLFLNVTFKLYFHQFDNELTLMNQDPYQIFQLS